MVRSTAETHHTTLPLYLKWKPITPADYPFLYGEVKKGVGTYLLPVDFMDIS